MNFVPFCGPLFSHRFGFPRGPRTFIAAILAAIEHFLSFLRIEVRDRAVEAERLGLHPRIDFQVNATADNMADRWADNRHAVSTHQDDVLVSKHFSQRVSLLGVTDQHIGHTEIFPNVEDRDAAAHE